MGAPTYAMLRDSTQAALLEILGANQIPFEFNRGENTLQFLDTGSRVIFRPLDEFERLRGSNLAWFGADELTYTSEEAWLRLEGRLRDPKAHRLCGFGVWTPKGFDWVYKRFIENPVKGYFVVRAKPFENRFLLDKVPDYYARLQSSYDEQFYAQEALGDYVSYQQGRAYHAFNRELHVKPLKKDAVLPLHWALDFNVNPMTSVVVQISGDEVRVIDEIVLSRASTQEACEEFAKRHLPHAGGLTIYGDASAHHMQTSGTSDAEMIKRFFEINWRHRATYRLPKSNPLVRHRIAMLNSKLASADGRQCLVIDPRCRELIADLEQVQWRGNSNELDKDKDPKRTHTSDALGYLLWEQFAVKQRAGERGSPLGL